MIHPADLKPGSGTRVMGILNVTPDSFSGDGLKASGDPVQAGLRQAMQFIADGAHILDIGGESTRPGSAPVSAGEEIARVVPVIRAIRQEAEITLSVDTSKAQVAEAALEAGADWINDVWGLRADSGMAAVAARMQSPVVIMHNRSRPADVALQERLGGMYLGAEYHNLVDDVSDELLASASLAQAAGVKAENIILDPGIGFGKTVDQNLELINRLDAICRLGYPVLVGPSRKSFIGYTLDLPPQERVEGTAAAVAVGILRGASVIRVHDVRQMARVARMTDAILRSGNP